MTEREVRRYLDYLGVGSSSDKANSGRAHEKRGKRSLSGIIRAMFRSPAR
ncbi:MAG: hypothetical protein QUS33_06255 [Dehalococcoidia bacterium]|nr:hypothetical protein [Dehalococcoidia bacterium]